MARTLSVPVARPAPNITLLTWGGIALCSALLLPWFRQGREIFSFLPAAMGLVLLRDSPWVIGVVILATLAVTVALLPRGEAERGRGALAVGALGLLLTTGELHLAGRPFGVGAAIVVLSFLAVLGTGLALSGMLRVDAFLAGSVLWMSAFVFIFILFPLWTVLKASVVVDGRLTLGFVEATLRAPNFLLVNNPATPRNETQIAALVGVTAGVLVGGALVVAGRRWRAVAWGIAVSTGTFVLAALYLGFGAVRNSVLLAIAVGVVSTALGFLFALLSERSRLPTRRLLGPFSILPIITPPFVLGLAMIFLFGRRGFITYQVLGISTNIFFGPLGVAIAQILAYTPIAYLVLQGVVQAMDASMEEAAETLGASRWHTLRTVTWPLARPGLANAFFLVAIESLADFGNPIIIGGGVPYLATEVFFAIIGRFNPNEAAVYGVGLLFLTLLIFFIQRRWIGRRFYVTVTGRPSAATPRPLPAWIDYGVSTIFLIWMALLIALYGSVFVGSVTKLWGFDYTFTLQHLRDLSPQGWQVFRTSAKLSAYAAVPSVLVGFLIGYLVTRVDFPGRGALELSSMLSFAVPGTVMGIGYILAFNQGVLFLTGTEAIIILAFVFRNMPVGIRASVAAIQQIDRSLEEASTMLRANSAITLRRIVMPLVRSALFSGLTFSFVRAMTAVSQVIFLISAGTNLATTQLLSYVETGRLGRGAALASVLTLFMMAVILALYAMNRRLDTRAASEVATA